MRILRSKEISEEIAKLCIKANTILRKDVLAVLKLAVRNEGNRRAERLLGAIVKNAAIAKRETLAICQDTGLPIVFLELGQDVKILGDLKTAVNKGIEGGYRYGSLRSSIIRQPLSRDISRYSPAVIHFDIVKGDKVRLTVLPKGFGCENKAQLKMFNPTAGIDEIKGFVIAAVKSAGPDACPPFIVGVGIGGTADYAMYLAKKALLRRLDAKRSTLYAKLESDLFKEINRLDIGPMGLGGKTTCLGVNILTYPTHIAGLPVAVNISCHALRSATKVI